MQWSEEKQQLLAELSQEKTAHQLTLNQLEEERSALQGYTSLVDQAQEQIGALINEQTALREQNAALMRELEDTKAKLAAERNARGPISAVEEAVDGLHAETYRSLVEQKQHARIQELLKVKADLEAVVDGYSAQSGELVAALEQSKSDAAAQEEKTRGYLKLIAQLKQQLQDAKNASIAPPTQEAPPKPSTSPRPRSNSSAPAPARTASVEQQLAAAQQESRDAASEIRQKDAILQMQQRALEETQARLKAVNAQVDEMAGHMAELEVQAREVQSLRLERARHEDELQRLRERVERAEGDLLRAKQQQRTGPALLEAGVREKLEAQLSAARKEAAAAVSEQYALQRQCEELAERNTALQQRIDLARRATESDQQHLHHTSFAVDDAALLEKEREVTELNAQLAATQRELAAVTSAAAKGQAAEALQARVRDLELEVRNVQMQLRDATSLVNSKEEVIAQLRAESDGRIAALAVADRMIKSHENRCEELSKEVARLKAAAAGVPGASERMAAALKEAEDKYHAVQAELAASVGREALLKDVNERAKQRLAEDRAAEERWRIERAQLETQLAEARERLAQSNASGEREEMWKRAMLEHRTALQKAQDDLSDAKERCAEGERREAMLKDMVDRLKEVMGNERRSREELQTKLAQYQNFAQTDNNTSDSQALQHAREAIAEGARREQLLQERIDLCTQQIKDSKLAEDRLRAEIARVRDEALEIARREQVLKDAVELGKQRMTEQRRNADSEIAQLHAQVSELQQSLHKGQGSISQVVAERNHLQALLAEERAKLSTAEESAGMLRAEVVAAHREAAESKLRESHLKDIVDRAQERLAEISSAEAQLEQARSEAASANAKLAELRGEHASVVEKVNALIQKSGDAKQETERLNAVAASLERQLEIERAEIAAMRSATALVTERRVGELERQLTSAEEGRRQVQAQLDASIAELRRRDANLRDLRERVDAQASLEQQLRELRADRDGTRLELQARVRECEEVHAHAEAVREASERSKKHMAAQAAKLEDYKSQILAIARERDELGFQLKRASQESADRAAKVDAIKLAFERHNAEVQERQRQLESLAAEAERKVIVLQSERDTYKAQAEHLAADCTNYRNRVDAIRLAFDEQQAELAEAEQRRKASTAAMKEELIERIGDLQDRLRDAQQRVQEAEQQRNTLGSRVEQLTLQLRDYQSKTDALQLDLARAQRIASRGGGGGGGGGDADAHALREQRDRLREAVRSLQESTASNGAESGVLREQLATLQAQLAAEKSANDALRRRIQRERLGARLDALDSVGEQIHDLKRVLGGDWSSISSVSRVMDSSAQKHGDAVGNRTAPDALLPKQQGGGAGSRFLTPSNRTGNGASIGGGGQHQQQQPRPHTFQQPKRVDEKGRIVEEIASDRKRLEDLRQKLTEKK